MLGTLRASLDGHTVRIGPPIDPAYDSGEGQDALERRYAAQSGGTLENAVFFESFYGRNASCNPLAIDRELAASRTGRRPGTGASWTTPCRCRTARSPWSRAARNGGVPAGASRLIVVNDWLRRRYSRRPGQRVLQTWHGTPLKRLALHRPGFDPRRAAAVVKESRRWDVLLAQNPYAAGILRKAYAFLTRPIWVEGYPRNDVLSTGDGAATRAALGIGEDERVLLYAPTWRDDRSEIVDFVDPAALAADDGRGRAGAGPLPHPAAGPRHRGTARDRRHGYPDTSQLLLAADALITDYSSVMFDFSVTGKPMYFLVPDMEHYRGELRGFYFDLAAHAPGPVVRTQDELVTALRAETPRRTPRRTPRGAASSMRGMTAMPPSASCRGCSTSTSSSADDAGSCRERVPPSPAVVACGHVRSNRRTCLCRRRPDRPARRLGGERRRTPRVPRPAAVRSRTSSAFPTGSSRRESPSIRAEPPTSAR